MTPSPAARTASDRFVGNRLHFEGREFDILTELLTMFLHGVVLLVELPDDADVVPALGGGIEEFEYMEGASKNSLFFRGRLESA